MKLKFQDIEIVTKKPLKKIFFNQATKITTKNETEYIPVNYYCYNDKDDRVIINEFNDVSDKECAKKCEDNAECSHFYFNYSPEKQNVAYIKIVNSIMMCLLIQIALKLFMKN